jgi:hypothetical protein
LHVKQDNMSDNRLEADQELHAVLTCDLLKIKIALTLANNTTTLRHPAAVACGFVARGIN